jgi:hypothetical protein
MGRGSRGIAPLSMRDGIICENAPLLHEWYQHAAVSAWDGSGGARGLNKDEVAQFGWPVLPTEWEQDPPTVGPLFKAAHGCQDAANMTRQCQHVRHVAARRSVCAHVRSLRGLPPIHRDQAGISPSFVAEKPKLGHLVA